MVTLRKPLERWHTEEEVATLRDHLEKSSNTEEELLGEKVAPLRNHLTKLWAVTVDGLQRD